MDESKTFKFNLWVIAITFVLQAVLLSTPFIPKTAGFWHANSQQDFYNNLAAFLGAELLLFSTAMTVMIGYGAYSQDKQLSDFRLALPLTMVKKLTAAAFYPHFRSAVEDAQVSVRIAYLAPYPPSEVKYEERNKYYQEVLALMKKRRNVTFRRLIRASPKNDPWVAKLVSELEHKPNVDIAVLNKDLPPDHEMPLALSVQIVDDAKCWLVAVGSHETQRGFRDVYIENDSVASVLSDYYDRLWQTAETFLDHGRVTNEGRALLERVKIAQ